MCTTTAAVSRHGTLPGARRVTLFNPASLARAGEILEA
jgi:hypothetical protein